GRLSRHGRQRRPADGRPVPDQPVGRRGVHRPTDEGPAGQVGGRRGVARRAHHGSLAGPRARLDVDGCSSPPDTMPLASLATHPGAIMTAFVLESQPFRRGPSPEAAAAVGLVSVVAVLTLFAAGVTSFALAIAVHWLFAIMSIISFAGSAMVAVKAD